MRIIDFLLLGCSFKNSPKIHESVFTFLSLDRARAKLKGMGSDID